MRARCPIRGATIEVLMAKQEPSYSPLRLEGKLLLAETTLRDGIFQRSVILITRHGEEGAHGYILNQPIDRKVDDLLGGEEFEALADLPVFNGGPVATERLIFAAMSWDHRKRGFHFRSHLSTDDARDACLAGHDVRAYVGYSGWSPGQLENELERHSWIVAGTVPALADPEAIPDLWARILRGLSPFHAIVALTPEMPERN